MEMVPKHYPLDGLTKIQTVETLVSQFSIVPAVIKQVAVKVIGLPYLPRKWFAD